MIANPNANEFEQIVEQLRKFHPGRNYELFSEFLPYGYEMTTLQPMPEQYRHLAMNAKLFLATLITFQDDLADNPIHQRRNILEYLYRLDSQAELSTLDQEKVHFSNTILRCLENCIVQLPKYAFYRDIFNFDMDQIYNANRFSYLMSTNRGLNNTYEMKMFGPFNMGMVAAATIDLMACHTMSERTAPFVREASYLGQEAGRISNIVTTFERELAEGDQTNIICNLLAADEKAELNDIVNKLEHRHSMLVKQIEGIAEKIHDLDLKKYSKGISKLHLLHLRMKGTI